MSPAELVENALEIGNRVDVQWGLFVTVHLALLGAMAYLDQPLHKVEKTVAVLVYGGFAAVNFAQMHSQLELLNAVYLDVHRLALDGSTLEIIKRMSADHLAGRHRYSELVVNVSHSLMAILVVMAIVFHPLVSKKADTDPE